MIFGIVLNYFLLKERPKFNFSLVLGIFVNLVIFMTYLTPKMAEDRIPSHKKDKQNQSLTVFFFYLKEKQLEIKNFEQL